MHEQGRLLVYTAGKLAMEHKARGLKLNLPETTAVITSFLLEGARKRDGGRAGDVGPGPGRGDISRRHQACNRDGPGAMKAYNPFENPDFRSPYQGEPRHTSDDPGRDYPKATPEPGGPTRSSGACGPSEPRRPGTGERQAPRRESAGELDDSDPLVPGELLLGEGDIEINVGLEVTTIKVVNGADRPIQVGSHFHFAEVNTALEFDRSLAWGQRLNVLSGGSVRFEPGAVEEVELVPIQGQRIVLAAKAFPGNVGLLDWIVAIDIENLGYVIVAILLVTWLAASAYWRIAKLEARYPGNRGRH